MQEIKFIKDIWYDGPDRMMYTKARSGHASKLFIRQGDLDSSCSVYSLMMVLMMLRKVNFNELYSREAAMELSDEDRDSVMQLQDTFLRNLKGHYREEEAGYYFDTLNKKLRRCFGKEVKSKSYEAIGKKSNSPQKQALADIIKDSIDNNRPIEIGITFEKNKGGHAVVVIGYTYHKHYLRLFCLDPGFDLPKTSFWNSIVDFAIKETDLRLYRDWYINPDESIPVTVDEVLTIE